MAINHYAQSQTEAFLTLGAKRPVQEWSQFDVSLPEARKGKASVLVTTVWNYQHTKEGSRRHSDEKKSAIRRDRQTGSLWYGADRKDTNTERDPKKRNAHIARIETALRYNIPIIGVLKDYKTGQCSNSQVFDCTEIRESSDGSILWMKLQLRGDAPELFETQDIDIDKKTVPRDFSKSTADINRALDEGIAESLKLDPRERLKRLKVAPKKPARVEVTSVVFERNPDVVAEVLYQAKGRCGACGKEAPFLRRKDNTPYLEVHHVTPLSEGGEDTVSNAIALCPNCHRKRHYGSDDS